jgi:hypothetical protein
VDQSRSLVPGGFQTDLGTRIVIRFNAAAQEDGTLFSDATRPTSGKTIELDGADENIQSVKNAHGAYLVLTLSDLSEP